MGYHYNAAGNQQACRWNPSGLLTDLGGLGGPNSVAYGINTQGWIVGQATNAAGRGRAFAWLESVGDMVDLTALVNDPDWIFNTAYGINDKGEIVGWGWYQGVHDQAFLLRPLSPVPPPPTPWEVVGASVEVRLLLLMM